MKSRSNSISVTINEPKSASEPEIMTTPTIERASSQSDLIRPGTPIYPGLRNAAVREDLRVVSADNSLEDGSEVSLNIIKGDLFSLNGGCLIHCLSADLSMSKGIAKEFDQRYGDKEKLRGSIVKPRSPSAYILEPDLDTDLFRGVLITKEKKSDKPTLDSLKVAMRSMRSMLVARSIDKISMPKIASGLDQVP